MRIATSAQFLALTTAVWLCAPVLAGHGLVWANSQQAEQARLPSIERLKAYVDRDYGFEIAVPESWTHVFAAEDDSDANALEPGYAIAFESAQSHETDVFADYLMVEILPGAATGAFDSDGTNTAVFTVDGRVAVTDRVNLDGFDINGNKIDLVVFQAEIVELGFTVGIYAIGERREAAVLEDAFYLALQSLKVPEEPFLTG